MSKIRKFNSKERNEQTSERVASIAAKGMRNPKSLTDAEIQSVSASAATQAGDKCETIIEIIRHFADGRQVASEMKAGERVALYGDEVEIEVNVK